MEKVVQHPEFRMQTVDYDFSLLKLETSIALSASKKPVNLPKQSEEIPDGTNCMVSGWGHTKVSHASYNFGLKLIFSTIMVKFHYSARNFNRYGLLVV